MWQFQFFPPQNLANLGHFFQKKTFEEFTKIKIIINFYLFLNGNNKKTSVNSPKKSPACGD
jgi:hypothetical protein